MNDDDPALQAYYAARAPEYDAVYRKPERQADLAAIARWLPDHFAGRRVLELACGTGYWTRLIAPVATHVLAIDAAPATLAIARTRVPAAQVTLAVGDAYAPPHEVPPRAAAFAGFWFSHVPRRRWRAFIVGLNAVLAPGATVVWLDNRYVPGSSTPIASVDDAGDAWQQRALADGSTHRVLKNFPTEAELRTALQGLAVGPSWHGWTHYWALSYQVPKPA